jgi:predicted TPR repeat methyltransferase
MDGNLELARDFFVRGVGHYQAGQLEQAEINFAAALALMPGRVSTLTNLGATRLQLGKFAEAADLLGEALAIEPDNVEALGHRATALAELGQHSQALACTDRVLALAPALGPAWGLRGKLLNDMGRPQEAIVSLENAIERGADTALNRYCLASLTGHDVPPAPPTEYVQGLFDGYAAGFEEHLVRVLNYRVPEALTEQLGRMGRTFARALDLGCGTGLCGPLMRPLATRLEGIDLSANMVRQASARSVYDQVTQADIVEYLSPAQARYDLVLAADVFIYVGALEQVFEGVANAIDPGGVFCFSVEAAREGQDLTLRPSMRYAHSPHYIRRLAEQHRFEVAAVVERPIREDQRIPIPGVLFWLVKRA